MTTVGFIGLGVMGRPMAGNLLRAGYDLVVHNRSRDPVDALVEQVTASTQGFTLVLAGLKALLEHDVRLNLVADRYPKGIQDH